MRIWLSIAVFCLFTSPAPAFDCAKATTPVEKAICADESLKQADDGLEKSYAEVRALSSKAERKMLALAQKKWIAAREAACAKPGNGQSGCIRSMIEERLKLFSGQALSGPGVPGRIIPVFIVQEGSETQFEIDQTLFRFADPQTPGEKRFNAITEEIGSTPILGPHGQDANGQVHAAEGAMVLTYAGPRLISIEHSFYSNTGGAHGNGGSQNFHIDPQSGRDYWIGDFLSGEAANHIRRQCREQIIAQKKALPDNGNYDPASDSALSDEVIAEHVATLAAWSFRQGEARIRFDAYAVGAYAEGSFECLFPMDVLKPLALPGAPLPE